MNLNLSDSDFYDAYGCDKEDAAELLLWRIEKLQKELKEVLKWNKEHYSQSQENQSS